MTGVNAIAVPGLKAAQIAAAVPATDADATDATKALYRRLLGMGYGQIALGANERACIIGTDTLSPYGTPAQVATAAGKTPLWLSYEWPDPNTSPNGYAAMVAALKAHHAAGGICAIHVHWFSYTGGNSWRRRKDSYAEVTQIKNGGAGYATWTALLDRLATFFNVDMVDSSGNKIPVILRLFHECNGWYDYTSINLTAASWSGNTYTFQTATPHGFSSSLFRLFVEGCSPSGYNQYFEATAFPNSTTFEVAGWTGNPGTCTVLGTVYAATGFWWAGSDRAADLMTVWRETVAYLRDAKGVHNALYCWCMYPYDGNLFPSSDPSSYPYAPWWPGDAYVDICAIDYYGESVSGYAMTQAALRSSMGMLRYYSTTKGKPFGIAELGYRGGMSNADLMTTRTFNAIHQHFPDTSFVAFWDQSTFPAPADTAYAGFQSALQDSRVIGR